MAKFHATKVVSSSAAKFKSFLKTENKKLEIGGKTFSFYILNNYCFFCLIFSRFMTKCNYNDERAKVERRNRVLMLEKIDGMNRSQNFMVYSIIFLWFIVRNADVHLTVHSFNGCASFNLFLMPFLLFRLS